MVDPLEAMRAAWGLLRDGGLVALEVPNILSPAARSAGADREHLRLPYHACFFPPGALGELLWRSGFELLSMGALQSWFLQVFARKAARTAGGGPVGP